MVFSLQREMGTIIFVYALLLLPCFRASGRTKSQTSWSTRPIDFRKDEHIVRLEANANDPWGIRILPLSEVLHVTIPGSKEGIGDDVFYLDGSNPDTVTGDYYEMTYLDQLQADRSQSSIS